MSLATILGAAGLAGATGHRAFIPALALGCLHRIAENTVAAGAEPFFALSDQFIWLADPIVMVVLGVLTVVEVLAEMNPDAPELVNLSLKLPKLVSGFVVAAAEIGTISDSTALMVGSGILGAGTALGVDTLRADVKHTVDGSLADASDGLSTRVIGGTESIWAAVLAVSAVVLPIVAAVGVLLLVGIWIGTRKAAQAKFVPCPHCNEPRHPEASSACPHCQASITGTEALPAPEVPADALVTSDTSI